MKGSVGRRLHRQCCNVRNATQCHLKPTGTVPGLLVHRPGKNGGALLGKASSCNTRVKHSVLQPMSLARRCTGREEAQEPLGRTSSAGVEPPEECNRAASIHIGEEDLPLSFALTWHSPLGLLWERRCLDTIDN